MNPDEKKRRLPKRSYLTIAVLFLLIPATIFFCYRLGGRMYYLASILIIFFTMLPFFLVFEHRRPQARELVVLAVLCALAIASRVAFAFLPQFKPIMAIIMITGIAFGPEAGFLCGAISAFASNFYFGQGPWTPWQMFAYGIGGFLAGLFCRLGILPKKRLPLSIFGAAVVMLIVGPLLDTSTIFMTFAGANTGSILGIYLAGVPMNAIFAAATFLTLFFFSKPLLEKLERVQIKYGMLEDS